MAINTNAPAAGSFAGMFGNKGAPAAQTPAADRPKSQFWLNIGYEAEPGAEGEDAGEFNFVSLPVGMPLDGMNHLTVPNKDGVFKEFQLQRNQLLDDVAAKATALKPGESCFVNLRVQIRRVADDAAPAAANPASRFARKVEL